MTFISYAQNLEDVILWRALNNVQSGFYVDVGANDPIKDSVTNAFYEKGWHGINIEPDDDIFTKLSELRPNDINLKIAIGNTKGVNKFYKIKDTGWSTLNSKVAELHRDAGWHITEDDVPTRTLNQVLDLYVDGPIHFLKIDVEGFEKEVLIGLDLNVWRPWILLIEATEPNSQIVNYLDWEYIVTKANYHFVYFDGLNRYYLAQEHNELSNHFKYPPNFFDGYRLADHQEALNSNDQLSNELGILKKNHQHLLDDYAKTNNLLEEKQKQLQVVEDFLISLHRKSNDYFSVFKELQIEFEQNKQKIKQSEEEKIYFMAQIESLKKEVWHWQQQVTLIYQSLTYRLTDPLRRIYHFIQKLLKAEKNQENVNLSINSNNIGKRIAGTENIKNIQLHLRPKWLLLKLIHSTFMWVKEHPKVNRLAIIIGKIIPPFKNYVKNLVFSVNEPPRSFTLGHDQHPPMSPRVKKIYLDLLEKIDVEK